MRRATGAVFPAPTRRNSQARCRRAQRREKPDTGPHPHPRPRTDSIDAAMEKMASGREATDSSKADPPTRE